MPLVPIAAAFDHPDWVFELKHDGFRALAHVEGHRCTLVSRTGHVYKQFPMLTEEIAHEVRANPACWTARSFSWGSDGRSLFNRLLFRRDWPHFVAFDVLSMNGTDLRDRALLERKRRLRAIMPRIDSRLVYMDHLVRRGVELFAAVCATDLEGIVAKWRETRSVSQQRWRHVLAEDPKSPVLTDRRSAGAIRRAQSGDALEAGEGRPVHGAPGAAVS
jgi:bifunctional non-homologous end joining protein LigD